MKLTKDQAQAIEGTFEAHFQKLVPHSGNATTVEGEVVRALMKTAYRDYNDGDKFWHGYGTETAGPAAGFLTSEDCPLNKQLRPILESTVDNFDDEFYTDTLRQAMDVVNKHIESLEELTPNSESIDMLKYPSEYEDEDQEFFDYDDEEDY